jgi:hypothetical protein
MKKTNKPSIKNFKFPNYFVCNMKYDKDGHLVRIIYKRKKNG